MAQHENSTPRLSVALAALVSLGLGGATASMGYEPTQSTGTGTQQGEDASISTKRGGNTSPQTGRNEHSGSATGAVRDPKNPEPEADKNKGSHMLGSHSSHEGKTGGNEGRGQAGAKPDK
jgi:hypothetical protein